VKAVLTRCGVEPRYQEAGADFLCTIGGKDFVAEAKRLTSFRQLRDRLTAAYTQIERSRRPGLVFVSVANAVNPGPKILPGIHDAASLRRAQRERANALVGRFSLLFCRRRDCRLLAVVMMDHFFAQTSVDARTGAGHWNVFAPVDLLEVECGLQSDVALRRTILHLVSTLGLPQRP
jgi:hypothetical protein